MEVKFSLIIILFFKTPMFLSESKIDEVVKSTMVGGATLTKLLGTSAWYAPGSSIAYVVDSVLNDHNRIIPCSVYLDGEYGFSDICIGVPCVIGKNGVEKIEEINLDKQEKSEFLHSIEAVKKLWEAASKIDPDLAK